MCQVNEEGHHRHTMTMWSNTDHLRTGGLGMTPIFQWLIVQTSELCENTEHSSTDTKIKLITSLRDR